MKESYLYEKLENGVVRCRTCPHYCLLPSGKRGICGVRENKEGRLFALNYAMAVAADIDPIEKKPLFHFLPGSKSLSIATVGCNLRCQNCQNWEISQSPKPDKEIIGEKISPEEIVAMAIDSGTPTISYTYTEPTIFLEYALDIMKLAKKSGLKNVWVSNGYTSEETFDFISPFLDAANIDLKSFSDDFYIKVCGARLKPVLDTLKRLKKKNIWLEITTLVIPTLSDTKEMFKDIARFIKNELGPETPWHLSQFSGKISWQLHHLKDTPLKSLEMGLEIGKEIGLRYVYVGNVFDESLESTYCPNCNTLCISRKGYFVERYDDNGHCPKCGEPLDLVLR